MKRVIVKSFTVLLPLTGNKFEMFLTSWVKTENKTRVWLKRQIIIKESPIFRNLYEDKFLDQSIRKNNLGRLPQWNLKLQQQDRRFAVLVKRHSFCEVAKFRVWNLVWWEEFELLACCTAALQDDRKFVNIFDINP